MHGLLISTGFVGSSSQSARWAEAQYASAGSLFYSGRKTYFRLHACSRHLLSVLSRTGRLSTASFTLLVRLLLRPPTLFVQGLSSHFRVSLT
ncbi:unnamed protein product [Protopolystoma xenopodis]|uniref:Uncharacterized protein n=1 Tax=Protopolystoma xenopodis TaxID=117903 RepID=A0A448X6T5_9PLAT|nr:unnamed protein product [Protopolystoma xenopodis]